jgi:hypothetical protein
MAKQRITQILERAKIRTEFPKRQVEVIDVRYVGPITGHGSGLYVRIPKEICDYYDLVAGNQVKIIIAQQKRWTDIEEK